MRKVISMLAFLLVCATSIAQPYTPADSLNQRDNNGLRQGYWQITAGMKNDACCPTDFILEEGLYLDDERTGVWTAWYPTGILKSRITFDADRPRGISQLYYSNGSLREEGVWDGRAWTGNYTLYHENGRPSQKFTYTTTGKRQGDQYYYFESGILQMQVFMRDGKEEGIKKEYNCKGQLARETFYHEGVLDVAKTKQYNSLTCERDVEVPPKNPEPIPPRRDFIPEPPFTGEGHATLYKDGQIVKKGTFHQYKLIDGEERIYDENGLLIQIKMYRDGKYVGDGVLPTN